MAMLQVRDMDDRLYERLKFVAKLDNRSISQQVVTILQDYFTSVHSKTKNATEAKTSRFLQSLKKIKTFQFQFR